MSYIEILFPNCETGLIGAVDFTKRLITKMKSVIIKNDKSDFTLTQSVVLFVISTSY